VNIIQHGTYGDRRRLHVKPMGDGLRREYQENFAEYTRGEGRRCHLQERSRARNLVIRRKTELAIRKKI